MIKTCENCGKEFEARCVTQKYCCKDCRVVTQAKRIVARGTANASKRVKICPICEKKFTADTNKRMYCSDYCARKAARKRLKERTEPKRCVGCGELFAPIYEEQKYCSLKCFNKTRKERATNISVKPPAKKTFDDWVREANACGLSYGNYKTQVLTFGKTFEELRAAYLAKNEDDLW